MMDARCRFPGQKAPAQPPKIPLRPRANTPPVPRGGRPPKRPQGNPSSNPVPPGYERFG